MGIQKIISDKSEIKKQLLQTLWVKGKPRALGLVCNDLHVDDDFITGLAECNADFVFTAWEEMLGNNIRTVNSDVIAGKIEGFDFFLCSGESEWLQDFLEKGVVPIIHKKNTLSSLLKDFNPIKWEGNAFLYEENNKWSVYAALVKYLENYKFPYDNKNLVKNIMGE